MARRNPPVTQEVLDIMLQPQDIAEVVRLVVKMPARVCVNELVISPAWNSAFGAPLPLSGDI
jgi:NADP-dependent 3-hydroxy acid dehydrogenase YdfG